MRSDVLILGAGASGLFCAAHAARRGRAVTLLDHGDRPARKVLASGGGRCNFTNLGAEAGGYACANPHFVKSALARFTPYDALDFFASRGIEPAEKEAGQLFSAQGAAALASVLERECTDAGSRLVTGCAIESAAHKDGAFEVASSRGVFTASSLVLALGGPSWPALGATDLGLRLASDFGLRVIPPRPVLVPLTLSGKDLSMARDLAGVSLFVRLSTDNAAESGDLLFTHRGLSGPAVLQLSGQWSKGMEISIDFSPEMDLRTLLAEHAGSKMGLGKLLARRMPSRLPPALLGELAALPANQLDEPRIRKAEQRVHAWKVTPSGTEGMKKAEAAAGGIDTDDVSSKTMEARQVPGLFAIGEALDVAGRLGGFNLQWAWSSGFAAGQYA